jgi:hypothetical protein
MKTLLSIVSVFALVAFFKAPVVAQGYAGPSVRLVSGGPSSPAFCRSGRGHPVHGWTWCEDHHWRSGRAGVRVRAHARPYWTAVAWRPVFVASAAQWGRHPIPEAGLESVVGRKPARRIRKHARRSGLQGPLVAHRLWSHQGGPGLEIWSAGRPVVRLLDYDRDGWAETTLLWAGGIW